MLSSSMATEETPQARAREAQHAPYVQFQVVLKPLTHPELGDIQIEDDLFAVGRTEQPFARYGRVVAAEMSRRHARIFAEHGAVFVADLGSKNGTSVNGVAVKRKPRQLRHGDELRFGGDLAYRVELTEAKNPPARTAMICCLTLTPERVDLNLQPIVIARFPFLVSKADEVFARYRVEYPHQVNYISRRHAHIFLHGGAPFVEDLGSTNGTFVDGQRLDEHAVPLAEGSLIAFGGSHFAYRVSVIEESESTRTRVMTTTAGAAQQALADIDKTTFVGAADSFLDIFCVDNAPEAEDEVNREVAPQTEQLRPATEPHRPTNARSKRWARWTYFISELRQAFGRAEAKTSRRIARWSAVGVAVLAIAGSVAYFRESPRRGLENLLASGDYANAAGMAGAYLAKHPQDEAMQALGTEALFRAYVPEWVGAQQSGAFERAAATLAKMSPLAASNPDAQALLRDLAWVGDIQRFIATRGGPEAPIPIFRKDDPAQALIQRWEDDPKAHQRALSRIGTWVPEFKDRHALALSQLRKLESDDSVYVAAIERLKTTVRSKLENNEAGDLDAVFTEYAERYPRLTGLDELRRDLALYQKMESETREGSIGTLILRFQQTPAATPLFQEQIQRLQASRLPPPEALQRYRSAQDSWRKGAAGDAMAALQSMGTGPWSETITAELAHKKAVAEQFAALQQNRSGDAHRESLLSLSGTLDPVEDAFYVSAIEPELASIKTDALARARSTLARAKVGWEQYQRNGAISPEQRREAQVSAAFRSQATLLAQVQRDARQGARMLALLNADEQNQGARLRDDIEAEARQQRRSLKEAGKDLEAGALQAKLALIGG